MTDLVQFYSEQELNEFLITFNKKAYPNFGNVVIIGGGAGSGKGFQLGNILGIEGKVLDVDHLKKMAQKTASIVHQIKNEFGIDITYKKFSLQDPKNTSKLHMFVNDFLDLPDRNLNVLIKSIVTADPERKPNLIFDVTLKNITKLHNITKQIEVMGYDKKNIHLVWVINDLDVAIKQNIERGKKPEGRTVPEDILIDTHKGAAYTMKAIIDMGAGIKKYLDGDIWFTFNQANVDTVVAKSVAGGKGEYIKKVFYEKIKSAGQDPISYDNLKQSIVDKIKQYTPKISTW